jgi:hypothetical protein
MPCNQLLICSCRNNSCVDNPPTTCIHVAMVADFENRSARQPTAEPSSVGPNGVNSNSGKPKIPEPCGDNVADLYRLAGRSSSGLRLFEVED